MWFITLRWYFQCPFKTPKFFFKIMKRYCPALHWKHFYFKQIGIGQCNDEHTAEEEEDESIPFSPGESNEKANDAISMSVPE